jgi:uncharacterized repeat protein (TIGR02543 family)
MGWATSSSGAVVYEEKEYVKNLTATNGAIITLYAVWQINSYTVTYDYITNGGTEASKDIVSVNYGSAIDLTVTAKKTDYTFVGWNTDPTANTGLTSLTMSTNNVKLYAIFKKTITITFVEMGNSGTVTSTLSDTVYNNVAEADFLVSEKATWTGWTNIGWTDNIQADAVAITSTGATFTSGSSKTLYALYSSEITVSYDTNGSFMVIGNQTKESFYNASGNSLYPTFIIANAPIFSSYSFVEWKAEDGSIYTPGGSVVFQENTILTATWDKYPELEAYNRYFTLEQAKNGEITEAELLKKVVGTDLEDGVLVNGRDVIVKNYSALVFSSITTDKTVEITYQAKDSFGNTVTKAITVYVTDTTMKVGLKKSYVRFISSTFFADNVGDLVPFDMGGVEDTSIWRLDESYRNLLKNTLIGENGNVEIWRFTKQDIKDMKEYTNTYGMISNTIDIFFERFLKCKQ